MESLIPEGIKQIAQQGFGYLMSCFAIAGLIWVLLRRDKEREAWDDRVTKLQEAWRAESLQTIKALHEGTLANSKLAAAQEATIASRNALHQLVVQMERDMDRNNEAWKPQVSAIVSALSSIQVMQATINGKLDQLLGRQS